jgi:hypothetical protein
MTRLQQLLQRLSSQKTSSRWLAVVDSSVHIGHALASNPNSGNVFTIEAAAGGLYDCVLSDYIKEEVIAKLGAPRFGSMSREAVEATFEPMWEQAIWLPLADDDPTYRSVVQDPKDVPILRTAMAVYFVPDLATRPRRFIISNNTTHFPDGEIWQGFEFITAHRFQQELVRFGRR